MRGVVRALKHSFSILRVFLILGVALFLPQLCVWYTKHVEQPVAQVNAAKFKLGLENLSESTFKSLTIQSGRNKRAPSIALITNQTGTDQEGTSNSDILTGKGFLVKKILVPQGSHFEPKASEKDKVATIPIITFGKKDFNKKIFADIDALMFDMQDSGIRYYGYITTLLDTMEAAAQYKKKFIVLDRPNLLGWCMEGVLTSDNQLYQDLPVPLRHGMTVGELAQYFNKYVLSKPVDLQVVPMEHYNRQVEARQPGMGSLLRDGTSVDACYGYSVLGLLGEVAPFDIGVGTDKAFQCVLLPERLKFPKHKWHDLHVLLKEHGIESKSHRYFNTAKKEYCVGLRLHINDINRFSAFNTLLTVLDFFKESGITLTCSEKFDRVLGTKQIRSLVQGNISRIDLALKVNDDLQSFYKKAFSCFIYKPLPKVLHV